MAAELPSFVSPLGIAFLLVVGVLLPFTSIRGYLKLKAGTPLPARRQLFIQTCTIQLFFLALSLVVAKQHWFRLFPRVTPGGMAILAAVVFLGIAVGTAPWRWRATKEERRRRLFQMMPATKADQAAWCGLCLLVGLSEEITYRGVLYGLLLIVTGNIALAIGLASLIFALNHAVQGPRTVVYVFFFALAFHAMVWLAGSLYVAMAAHALYDMSIGFIYGRLGRAEFGVLSPAPAQTS